MGEEIELAVPDLVPMRPEDRREAVRLLAALIRTSARSPTSWRSPANLPRSSHRLADGLPMPEDATGNPEARESAGGTG